jgi:nucleoside-diphosphate-sugar epimerase
MKKALIVGATGMTGSLVLKECLSSDQIEQVISISRRPTGIENEKLKEIIHGDFLDLSSIEKKFENVDMLYFCIGVYTGKVDREKFREITVDYTRSICGLLKKKSPKATICFLSGQGADRSEKSKMMFAKDKGVAENYLFSLELKGLHIFRPGYIYPVTPRKEPNFTYKFSRSIYPFIKLFGSKMSIKSSELAKAMFTAGFYSGNQKTYENKKIFELLN